MNISKLTKEELLADLKKHLEDQVELIERQELSSEAFSKSAWPYYQANNLGQKKAYRKILKRYYD